MIRSEGVVVEIDSTQNAIWVEIPQRTGACGNCSASGVCQTEAFGDDVMRRYKMPNLIDAKVGDRVSFGVADGTLLRVSWFSYLLPALLAICLAAAGQNLGGDPVAMAGTFMGLGMGFLCLRRVEHRAQQSSEMLSLEHPQAMCHVRESK